MDLLTFSLLFFGAILAGVINTVGGGGSVITLPLMIFAGLPPDVANATNRIALVPQGAVGLWQFQRGGVKEHSMTGPLVAVGCLGAVFGTWIATLIPAREFTLILAILMLVLLGLIIARPKPHLLKEGAPENLWKSFLPSQRRKLLIAFFFLGIYGGFLQAGIGIMILLTLGFLVRMDLTRANYVKLFFVMVIQTFSAILFTFQGIKLAWMVALIMITGQCIGAYAGAWVTLKMGERTIINILIASCLLSSGKLLWDYFQG